MSRPLIYANALLNNQRMILVTIIKKYKISKELFKKFIWRFNKNPNKQKQSAKTYELS